jgi:hypothetical protein
MNQEAGDQAVNEQSTAHSLLDVLKTLKPIEEDFAPIADPPPRPDDI